MSGRSPAPAAVSAREWARTVLAARARALRDRYREARVRVVALRDGDGLEADDAAGWSVTGTADEVSAELAARFGGARGL